MESSADLLPLGLAWFVVFLFSTTLHEAAHAFIALRLGDPTAYHGGQVTLNPLPHIRREPFGMVLVPILSFFMGGWMFGWASAPYDPRWALRHPRRAAWMALGGPAANLLLVVGAGLLIRLGMRIGYFYAPQVVRFSEVTAPTDLPGAAGLATLLSVLFTLNLVLFVFNLLPLPPLDGSGVVQLLMSGDLARRYQAFLRQPMLAWVGILVAWRLFGPIFRPIHGMALSLLYPGAGYQ
jgi:Zn-dependent protease